MQIIENLLALHQQGRHLGHEFIDRTLQLPRVGQWVIPDPRAFQLDQPRHGGHAERGRLGGTNRQVSSAPRGCGRPNTLSGLTPGPFIEDFAKWRRSQAIGLTAAG